jgi:hypothetical protein
LARENNGNGRRLPDQFPCHTRKSASILVVGGKSATEGLEVGGLPILQSTWEDGAMEGRGIGEGLRPEQLAEVQRMYGVMKLARQTFTPPVVRFLGTGGYGGRGNGRGGSGGLPGVRRGYDISGGAGRWGRAGQLPAVSRPASVPRLVGMIGDAGQPPAAILQVCRRGERRRG